MESVEKIKAIHCFKLRFSQICAKNPRAKVPLYPPEVRAHNSVHKG